VRTGYMKRYFLILIAALLLLVPVSTSVASESEALDAFSMGFVYLYDGELEMAKSQFKLSLFYQEAAGADIPSVLFAVLATVCDWLGEYDEAQQYAVRGLEANPDNDELLELYSMILLSEGRYEEALINLEKLTSKYPYNLDLLISLAETYDRIENEEGLIDVYQRMIRINPEMVDAHLNLGYIYTKRGQYGDAEKAYERVIELDPENEKAIFYLTYIYLSTGRTEQALELFEKLDSRDLLNDEMLEDYAVNLFIEGQDPRPILDRIENEDELSVETRAIRYFYEEKLERSRELFEGMVRENPEGITAYIGLIRIAEIKKNIDMELKWRFVLAGNYFKYRMFNKALQQAERVKVVQPENLENRYLLGDIYYALHRSKEAIAEYQYFEKKSQEKGDVWLKLGILYDEVGDHDRSIECFLRATELFPENDELYYYLGLEYRIVHDYMKAAEAFRKAIELKDDDTAEYYFNLGVAYERMGMIDDAIQYLDRAVQLDDTNPVSLNYLGYLLADEGIRLDEAKDFIGKALDQDPTNGAYLDSMGWVYYRLLEYEKARELLEKAVQYIDLSNEENYLIYDHLGDVYYVIGLFKEAADAWEKALQIKHTADVEKKIKELEEEIQ
jgi:tetratricopeptide (TPR) repeat protein